MVRRTVGLNMRYRVGVPQEDAATLVPASPPTPRVPKALKVPVEPKRAPGRPPGIPQPRTPNTQTRNALLPNKPMQIDAATAVQLAAIRVKYRTNYGIGNVVKEILERLPAPHEMQAKAELSPAKRKVIAAGRRGGKTTGAARVAIIKMCDGKRVLLASTTQDQADAFWEKCKDWLGPFIDSGEIEKNETRRILKMTSTGGQIKAKTASDADTLRGDYADFLVLDECALLAPDAWDKVGAPMLLDTDGDVWFLSTPRFRNWFYTLYNRASTGNDPRWEAFHFTSFGNPHLSKEAMEEIVQDLSEEAYRQEILAEFLEGEGAVFRDILSNLSAPMPAYPEEHRGHYIVMGVDWAQKRDYTVFSVFCATCKTEVELVRFNKIEWVLQRDRLIATKAKWGVAPQAIWAEENSIGNPNIEALGTYYGVTVTPFQTTMQSKGQIIRQLALSFERHEDAWLNIPVATSELEAFESKVSKVTGSVTYSAPDGINDDTVIARALAKHAALRGNVPTMPQAMLYSDIVVEEGQDDGSVWSYPQLAQPYTPYAAPGMVLPGLNYGNH